jgi:tripartite-type tricarboxylate transporter receptor subunit TctC
VVLGRCSAVAVVCMAVLVAASGIAAAQDYPTRPVRVIVPTAPGGLMDVAARLLSDHLDKALNQRFVIDNRGGAGGNVGADMVAKAPPDGYTIGLMQLGNLAISPFLSKDFPYDPLVDLLAVAPVTSSPTLVVANANLPIANLRELIALAKRQPGKLNVGSAGIGTAPHLAGELFAQVAGLQLVTVHYRGAGPAVTDLAAGQVQLAFVGLGAIRGQLEAGTVKVLAVPQPTRLRAAPDLPTAAEAGLPDYEFTTWFGVLAPRGTPERIVNTLVTRIHAMQDDPAVQKRLADAGMETLKEGPAAFQTRIRRDHDRMSGVIKAAGLKPE